MLITKSGLDSLAQFIVDQNYFSNLRPARFSSKRGRCSVYAYDRELEAFRRPHNAGIESILLGFHAFSR